MLSPRVEVKRRLVIARAMPVFPSPIARAVCLNIENVLQRPIGHGNLSGIEHTSGTEFHSETNTACSVLLSPSVFHLRVKAR